MRALGEGALDSGELGAIRVGMEVSVPSIGEGANSPVAAAGERRSLPRRQKRRVYYRRRRTCVRWTCVGGGGGLAPPPLLRLGLSEVLLHLPLHLLQMLPRLQSVASRPREEPSS